MTMSNTNDTVSLLINGKAHQEWLTYSIDSNMLTLADDWNMLASFDMNDPAGAVIPPFIYEGATVKVTLGSDVILNGIVDTIDDDITKESRYFEMYGRDQGGLLLDCSAPLLSLQEMTLDQIIKNAVIPLGIQRVEYRAKLYAPRQKFHTEPGETVWEWLRSACEANQVWPWFAPDGTLIIGTPDYTTPPVGNLIMRFNGDGNNVLQMRRTRSITRSYSKVTVLGQSSGDGDVGHNDIIGTATDPTMPLYRPLTVVDGNCETDDLATRRANKLMADGRMDRDHLVVTVAGHRVMTSGGTGQPWAPGMRVQVMSEPHAINAVYFVMRRKFHLSRDEQQTELFLIPDGTWILNLGFIKAQRRSDFGTRKGYYAGSNAGDNGG
jgi:prophage tail gpP-like protein